MRATRVAFVRPQAADVGQRRHAWRQLAEAAQRLAQRAVDTDGRETVEADGFGHSLARNGKLRFDVDGDSAAGASMAFLMLARATLNAGYPARRAIVAGALLAAAKAVDALLTEQADRDAQSWKRQTGED